MAGRSFQGIVIAVIVGIVLLFVVLPITCSVVVGKKVVDEVNDKGVKGISAEIWEGTEEE